jgi:hypothetical protein
MVSAAVLIVYLLGVADLSRLQEVPWSTTPVFWIGISECPLWAKLVSAITLITGTALIYFIPGIFVAKHFSAADEDPIGIFLKGFLLNYFFYYVSSTLYKAITHQVFSRESMVILIGTWILIAGAVLFLTRARASCAERASGGIVPDRKDLVIFYIILFAGIFFIFREKIFFAHFEGDAAEQYWLAHSLRSYILPTSFRASVELIPQFPFAPSLYLNLFALTLFGNAEFIIKIEILMAYMGLGFILKGLIEEIRGDRKLGLTEWVPLFLYLLIFFIIVAYRAGYGAPTDLAKSNETLQSMLFFSGFFLLAKRAKPQAMSAAIFFVLASMIRYNGLFAIMLFLIIFSILFKRYQCLLWYLAGLALVILLLNLLLIPSSYKFQNMVHDALSDTKTLRNLGVDWHFIVAYLKNYFIFTAGLSLFFILKLKNRYVLSMFLVSLVYLILPLRSDCVPAHYFVPILMFPLISYYVWK